MLNILYASVKKSKGDFTMKKEVIGVSVDADVKKLFDKERGLIKESTFANHILRQHYVKQGLLPEKV